MRFLLQAETSVDKLTYLCSKVVDHSDFKHVYHIYGIRGGNLLILEDVTIRLVSREAHKGMMEGVRIVPYPISEGNGFRLILANTVLVREDVSLTYGYLGGDSDVWVVWDYENSHPMGGGICQNE